MRRGVSGGVSVCLRRGGRGVLRVAMWRGRGESEINVKLRFGLADERALRGRD